MFTGLVEGRGRVRGARRHRAGRELRISVPQEWEPVKPGESVAVDGVCLTVRRAEPEGFTADVIPETLRRTTLGGLRAGSEVNLERALRVGDRLGGHWVQGHVDGVVEVEAVVRRGGERRLRLRVPAPLRRYVAEKGSVALQGVSLTVASVSGESFEVALIPETLERTTLGSARRGTRLNLEVDLLARYLERLSVGIRGTMSPRADPVPNHEDPDP